MNICHFSGNLGRDPELRYTPGGKAVCELNVAANERWTNRDGERQERTEWMRVTVWGATAEACEKYLSTGSKVLVTGRLQTDEYDDKDGIRRWSTKIIAQQVEFLDSRGDREGGSPRSESSRSSAPAPSVDPNDLPFE